MRFTLHNEYASGATVYVNTDNINYFMPAGHPDYTLIVFNGGEELVVKSRCDFVIDVIDAPDYNEEDED